jgi:hypothetical protein
MRSAVQRRGKVEHVFWRVAVPSENMVPWLQLNLRWQQGVEEPPQLRPQLGCHLTRLTRRTKPVHRPTVCGRMRRGLKPRKLLKLATFHQDFEERAIDDGQPLVAGQLVERVDLKHFTIFTKEASRAGVCPPT